MKVIMLQLIDEIKALGISCLIHGPEIWIGILLLVKDSVLIVIGMFIAALLTANDRNK